jgi:hypothetical protein
LLLKKYCNCAGVTLLNVAGVIHWMFSMMYI